jgi:uncharacterized protein (TIGR03083 family)
MTTQAISALRLIHAQVQSLLVKLDDDAWQLPSGCEGWRVQDVIAHMSSNMKETADPSPPPEEPPPPMGAEEAMDALVAPRLGWTPAQLRSEYDSHFEGWLGTVASLQEEPTASAEAPLADLGTYPMHMVANAFAFDHYCHLYMDLLAPGGPLEVELGDVTDDMVRPGVDWMIAGVPQMQPIEIAQAVTAPLVLKLTGAGGGRWLISPAVDGGLVTLAEIDTDAEVTAAATISSSAHDFVSWGTKRSDWRQACALEGDDAAATSFLDTLNII